jgi:hypothetical protein
VSVGRGKVSRYVPGGTFLGGGKVGVDTQCIYCGLARDELFSLAKL